MREQTGSDRLACMVQSEPIGHDSGLEDVGKNGYSLTCYLDWENYFMYSSSGFGTSALRGPSQSLKTEPLTK